MKQDTKETIGPRGTVQGFRPLIREERWHKDFTTEMLEGGWRPLLWCEKREVGDEYRPDQAWLQIVSGLDGDRMIDTSFTGYCRHRTKRPLPPPQVETFEAHGHVWYRHVPGDVCPVERNVTVDVLWKCEMNNSMHIDGAYSAKSSTWDKTENENADSVIGYRFPDFPVVHTPAQQEQHVEKTEQSFQHDTTKQRLATMYHGWCDVAPDSVAECIADVARVLYPTDAERCEAAFEAWKKRVLGVSAVTEWTAKAAWKAAWGAAKEKNP